MILGITASALSASKVATKVTVTYSDGTSAIFGPDVLIPQTQPVEVPATQPTALVWGSLSVKDMSSKTIAYTSGSSLSVAVATSQRIYIQSDVSGDGINRVDLDFGGTAKQIEKTSPWTYGMQFSPSGWQPKAGTYNITVTAYRDDVSQGSRKYVLTVVGSTVGDYKPTADGFSDLPLAKGAKIIYAGDVGNDATADGSKAKPYKTLQKAATALRKNAGDRIEPLAGSSFYGTVTLTNVNGKDGCKGGIVFPGTGERPKLYTNGSGIIFNPNVALESVAIVGLEIVAANRDPLGSLFNKDAAESSGVQFNVPKGSDILVEDNVFACFGNNVVGAAPVGKPPLTNVKIRRNIIRNAWAPRIFGGQGMYLDHIDGLLIEENVFVGNGIIFSKMLTILSTIYRHHNYINAECKNVIVRYNWYFSTANYAVQARGGGLITGNFVYDSSTALMTAGVRGEITNNVIFGGHVIGEGGYKGSGYNGIESASSSNFVRGNWLVGEPDVKKIPGLQYAGYAFQLTRREWTPAGDIACVFEGNRVLSWPGNQMLGGWWLNTPWSEVEKKNPTPKGVDVSALWPTAAKIAVLTNRPAKNWYTAYTPKQIIAALESQVK